MVKNHKETFRILLLMGTSHGYGRQLIDGATQYLYESGHRADFEFRGYDEPIPPWVREWKGDGILTRRGDTRTSAILRPLNVPVVTVSCLDEESDLTVDEDAVAALAVAHFQERGLQHFAYYTQCDLYWTQLREQAYVSAVERIGKKCHVFVRRTKTFVPWYGWKTSEKKRLAQWLDDLPKPVGLLAAHDLHAREILDFCQVESISVPGEVAILGTSNEAWFCRLPNPGLSSIIQDSRRLGYEAARILCAKIRGEPFPEMPLRFPPLGIETRGSTDVIAVNDEDMVQAKQLVREGAERGITVKEILEELQISRRTLERKYKATFGRTLAADIVTTRIERAKELLRETDWAVGNIARLLHFVSEVHFFHVFRREAGCSPLEYRQRKHSL